MVIARPKILYVTGHCPHADSYGAQLRSLHLGRLLQECGDVQLALVHDKDLDEKALARTRAEFDVQAVMRLFRRPVRGLRERLGHELDPWFLNVNGCQLNPGDLSRVGKLVAGNDLVWVHNLYTADLVGLSRCPRVILDVDDLMSQYYRAALRKTKSWKERLINLRQLWLWSRRESVLLKRFGLLTVCSDSDRRYLGGAERIHVVPNGYANVATEPKRNPVQPPRVGFIGTCMYPPNREGVEWFIRQVWPSIKSSCPTARFRMVGAGTDSEVKAVGKDVDGLGWVKDSAGEIATWSVAVVPLWLGGGTRIKIAESFSKKCPVVSTSWGAFGYEVTSGQELLLADDPETFARACLTILQDNAFGEQLVERAWEKYVKNWTWQAIAPKVAATIDHGLRLVREVSPEPVALEVMPKN